LRRKEREAEEKSELLREAEEMLTKLRNQLEEKERQVNEKIEFLRAAKETSEKLYNRLMKKESEANKNSELLREAQTMLVEHQSRLAEKEREAEEKREILIRMEEHLAGLQSSLVKPESEADEKIELLRTKHQKKMARLQSQLVRKQREVEGRATHRSVDGHPGPNGHQNIGHKIRHKVVPITIDLPSPMRIQNFRKSYQDGPSFWEFDRSNSIAYSVRNAITTLRYYKPHPFC
jgi:hypothetical protein